MFYYYNEQYCLYSVLNTYLAAAYLAKAGKKVLVLEKHNLPGGCATSFVRGRFEFEATLHEMCQMGRGIEGEPRGAVRDMGGDIWYNCEVTKIDVRDGAVHGVELSGGRYIPCERVIANLMPHVVFDRLVDPREVPEYNRKAMNAQKIAQACFTVYAGLDASAEELGLKGYDTFMRYDPCNRNQYLSTDSLDTHRDITVTVLTNGNPVLADSEKAYIQFSKFYIGDPFENVTEEEYFKIKDRVARECIERYEEVTGCNLKDHIEEIVVASPVTWARYLGTPRGDVYSYEPHY